MAYIHDLIAAPRSQFSEVLANPRHQLLPGCIIGFGVDGDQLVTIVSILRGLDLDEHVERLMAEVHEEYLEGERSYAVLISDSVRDEFAQVPDERITDIASRWMELEGDDVFGREFDPAAALRRLVLHAGLAHASEQSLIVKSFE